MDVVRWALGGGLAFAMSGCLLAIDPLPRDQSPAPISDGTDAGGGRQAADAAPTSPAGAAGDAGDAAAVEAGRFCDIVSPKPKLCEDFEEGTVPQGWTPFVDPGTTLAVDDKDARSGKYALLATTAGGVATSQHAYLQLTVPASVAKIRVGQDVRVELRGDYLETAYVRQGAASPPPSFYLRLSAKPPVYTAEAYLSDGGVPQHNLDLDGGPTFDAWTRLDVELDMSVTPRKVTVRVDGAVAAADQLEDTLYTPGNALVQIGIVYVDENSGPWRMRYDNVTVDWE